jgi:hypothetical protein
MNPPKLLCLLLNTLICALAMAEDAKDAPAPTEDRVLFRRDTSSRFRCSVQCGMRRRAK